VRPSHESNRIPKARADGLLIEHVGDETVVYDLESKHAHCLAPLAARVLELSDGETPVAEIASLATLRLGHDVSEAEVHDALAQLEDRALLDTPLAIRDGFSRREAIGKVAFAGATAVFAGSLVTTIAAPALAAGASQLPAGCTCTNNPDCQSGHCCKAAGSNDKCNNGCCADTNNGSNCQCVNGVCNSLPTPPAGSCGGAGVCTPTGGAPC
jgi:hypothetical protein